MPSKSRDDLLRELGFPVKEPKKPREKRTTPVLGMPGATVEERKAAMNAELAERAARVAAVLAGKAKPKAEIHKP